MPNTPTPNPKAPPVVPEDQLTKPRGQVLAAETPRVSWWLLAALIIILLVIFAALIAWIRIPTPPTPLTPSATRPTIEENNEPESTTAEAVTETLQALSPSHELSSIEADLAATVILDLDGSFADINALVGLPAESGVSAECLPLPPAPCEPGFTSVPAFDENSCPTTAICVPDTQIAN